ncbi:MULTISPECIES: CPBP family intramembrane glutamic endopeptidase [Meridianimarinicoccus]|uniref:CPBP family intramembrane glutamic endopeptidase n=1 Tax=Meridianimarinicoccus zhengii TaxID=2056810 RepID=UPI0013A6B9EC|nr:CPBP family intramembrane glutamic endopeptidase [Phycocomes zhengii]
MAPARTRPALWRLVPGLLIVVAAQALAFGLLVGGIWALAGPEAAGTWLAKLAVASTPATMLTVLALFAPPLLGVVVAARLLHRRGLRSLLGPRVLPDAARGAGVTLAVFAPLLALAWGLDATQPNLPLGIWAALLPLTVLGVAVQTLTEEILFRGYVLQQLAARFRSPLVWAVLPAALFGLLHLDPSGMGAAAWPMAAVAMLFGLVAADLTARSGGLGLAWGMHLANNLVGLSVMATQGGLTGLALRVTTQSRADLAEAPWMVLPGALPFLIAWLILRRGLRA